LVNVTLTSLASSARCVFTPFDDPLRVCRRLEHGDITLFMAVPTIYSKMIEALKSKASNMERTSLRRSLERHLRLMVSGSAALPISVLTAFKELSGHTLLERYGMTEIGMALSQRLIPTSSREPGTVGEALPTVKCHVVSDAYETAATPAYNQIGRLAIRSPSVFDRYWDNPKATQKDLLIVNDSSGCGHRYFDTGDTVGVRGGVDGAPPVFTILGRTSVDIIKCRGYKISALEVEAAILLEGDLVKETAVFGSRDETLGEDVVAVVVLHSLENSGGDFARIEATLRSRLERRLAHYKQPTKYVFVPQIPRNAMGKVNKSDVKRALGL
jgi:acyl-CoA synthetase (AMP-forming)/AMP-acid ligase II